MSLRGIILVDAIVWCLLTLALAAGVAAYYWQPSKPVITFMPSEPWCGIGETMHIEHKVMRHERGIVCWGPEGLVVADK